MPRSAFLLIYLALISLVSIAFTVYDKLAAKRRPKRRVPEKALMLLGALGGAAAMYATMLLIRHKTKHNKFMIGLPIMIAVQVLAALAVIIIRVL